MEEDNLNLLDTITRECFLSRCNGNNDSRPIQADPEVSESPDTPHSFELCPPRGGVPNGAGDCTSSSFDIVFEDSGCDRDADGETDSPVPGVPAPGALLPAPPPERAGSSPSLRTSRGQLVVLSSSPPRPTSLTLTLPPASPPAQRTQPSPKVG